MGIASGILRCFDHLIAPPVCPACGLAIAPTARLCDACSQSLPQLPNHRCNACGGQNDSVTEICHECSEAARPWFRGVTAFPYHGPAGTLIQDYKYRGQTALAPVFAGAMADAWRRFGAPAVPQAIVPIPLHWLRLRIRGFNQAELISRFLAKELQLPLLPALSRRHITAHQARLTATGRLKNLRRAFVVSADVQDMSLLLVDDVFTTGSTLTAATEALLEAGAAEVSVLTIARA